MRKNFTGVDIAIDFDEIADGDETRTEQRRVLQFIHTVNATLANAQPNAITPELQLQQTLTLIERSGGLPSSQ